MGTFGGAQPIVTDGLVFAVDAANYESYTSGSTTWSDLSGNSNNGTLTNGPTFDSGNGGSIVFDGSDDYVKATPIQPQYFSLCCWFKGTGAPANNDSFGASLICSDPQYNGTIPWILNYAWNDERVGILIEHNNTITTTSNGLVKQNNLYYACATYNGSVAKIYINGEEEASVARSTDPTYNTTGDNNVRIGMWGYSSYQRNFNGHIYNASIYNKALSSTEILQNYNALKSRFDL